MRIAALTAAVCLLLAGEAGAEQLRRVSTPAELQTALAEAQGGETILLAGGIYGPLVISNRRYDPPITIRAERPQAAEFDSLSFDHSSGIRVEQVHVSHPGNGHASSTIVAITHSQQIAIVDSEVNGRVDDVFDGHFAFFTRYDVRDIEIAGNMIHDVKRGGVFYNVEGLHLHGNTVERTGDDAFKFIAVRDVLIENNVGPRLVFPGEGAHLDFVQFQGADSSDVTIRGNVLLPGNWTDMQGIFFDDAHYTDILIEQNIIYTGMFRGISVSSGTNVVARYNTVLDVEGVGSKATRVAIAEGPGNRSYGNIESSHEGGVHAGNIVLQQRNPAAPYFYDRYFANARRGPGLTLHDLRPVAGSAAETHGAAERLRTLLPPS
ncbi:MAG: right-handed parallel beta-helix repeat-containing protein [Pseudomonadota bacterium]